MTSILSVWGRYIGALLHGLVVTIEITGLSLAVALVLGGVLAYFRVSRLRTLRLAGAVYVDVMRAVPVLVLLFMVYFGLGQVGFTLPGLWSATVALGAFYASLFCEIFRGGIASVEFGQREAAEALGMSRWTRLRRITLPQAFLAVLLPSTNQVSNIIKDSSLVLTIGVADLMGQAQNAAAVTFKPMDMYLLAGAIYFGFYLLISRALGRWELSVQRRRR